MIDQILLQVLFFLLVASAWATILLLVQFGVTRVRRWFILFAAWVVDKVDELRHKFFPHYNVACLDCQLIHKLPKFRIAAHFSEQGFRERHKQHQVVVNIYSRLTAHQFKPNADVKLAYGTLTSMTVTSLHSLASSVTAGWQSDEINNSSSLFLDILIQAILSFANTAPANSKGVYAFAAGGLETTKLSDPASGSQGTITLTDVTTTPQNLKPMGFIVYPAADAVIESSPWSFAQAFGGSMPLFVSLVLMNHSGAALDSSGNTVKYTGVYAVVEG